MYLSHSIPADVKCAVCTQHGCNVMRAFLIYLHICVNPIHTHTLACACMYLHTDVLPHSRTYTYTHKNAKQRNTVAFFFRPIYKRHSLQSTCVVEKKNNFKKEKKSNQKNIQNQICIMCINHEMVINCEKNASSNSETTWKKFREWKMNEKKWRQLWN